ncbi:MAG: hypothetical protein A3D28_03410 [Omnitrophica bacterium RIFCSPHIGHO2_02_FULL_63_14]|nr:MAG: hypothetical protein A3D28_03410 [Omnitrophica bacterium RIFCSPHIGHO2_02_FULL_63_14]
MTNEAKTGAFVLICLIALGALLFKVGNFTLLQEGYTIRTHLEHSSGVKKNAPVHLSGVNVGKVRDIRILYGDETMVEIELFLREGVKIRRDSVATVAALGLMGEKYIEIKAGSAGADYAKPGDSIEGEEVIRFEDMMKLGTRIGGDVSKMAKDIAKVAEHADEAVVNNRPKIDRIFDNFDETSENFRDFSQDIRYHPWKVLMKGKEKPADQILKDRAARLEARASELRAKAAPSETVGPA